MTSIPSETSSIMTHIKSIRQEPIHEYHLKITNTDGFHQVRVRRKMMSPLPESLNFNDFIPARKTRHRDRHTVGAMRVCTGHPLTHRRLSDRPLSDPRLNVNTMILLGGPHRQDTSLPPDWKVKIGRRLDQLHLVQIIHLVLLVRGEQMTHTDQCNVIFQAQKQWIR